MAERKVSPARVSQPQKPLRFSRLPFLTHRGRTTMPRCHRPSRTTAGTSREANLEVPWVVNIMTQLQTASGSRDGDGTPTNTATQGPAVGAALLRRRAGGSPRRSHQPAVPPAIPSLLSLSFLTRRLGMGLTFHSDVVTARPRLEDVGHMTESQGKGKHF